MMAKNRHSRGEVSPFQIQYYGEYMFKLLLPLKLKVPVNQRSLEIMTSFGGAVSKILCAGGTVHA